MATKAASDARARAKTARYCGAIDQGTSSTRFMLFDRTGAVVASAQAEHTQHYPKPGWVEHDANEIWEKTQLVIARALGTKFAPADVAAIGITNQRETTLVWDRLTGKPLYNAIVWNCTRTDEIAARVASRASCGKDRFRAKTGLPIVAYFSATKLVWLLENVPGLREAARAGTALFGTIDSWLIWKLTAGGVHATDVSNGSRTLLMNIHTLQWDAELLEAFDVPAAMLPALVPSSAVVGVVDGGAVAALAGVPIGGVLGDQQAATFGQVCFEPGQAKATYGTGAFIMMNTGERAIASRNGLLTTVGWQLGAGAKPTYCIEGGVAYAGSLVQWARDNLKLIASASEAEGLCESVADNGGVFIVPAFAGLFAPYWRSDARGVICGLTAFNTSAHLVRACVEAAAYQVKDILDAMASDSGVRLHALRCDGGMTANSFLMQFQADLLDVTVTVPAVAETTALGAASAAGLAVGFYADLPTLRAQWSVRREWTARMPDAQRAFLESRWAMAIERSLDWHAPAARQGSVECERLEMVRSGSSRAALDRPPRADGEGASASAWAVRAAALTALVLCAFASGRASSR